MSDSDCDWFDKDDDELMKDLERTVKAKQAEINVEYISGLPNAEDECIQELTLKTSLLGGKKASRRTASKKLNTAELEKIAAMPPLDMFLNVQLLQYDNFLDHIQLNDRQERVILYINILATMCRLELPGFHKVVLDMFRKNRILLQRIRLLTARLLCKGFQHMWEDTVGMQQLLDNVLLLTVQSITLGKMDEDQLEFLKDMLQIGEKNDNNMVPCRKFCQELKQNLQEALSKKQDDDSHSLEIFPSLEDILTKESQTFIDLPTENPTTVQGYILNHLRFLKQHFTLLLKDYVESTRHETPTEEQLPNDSYIYENVLIVVNEKFLDANRHELVFVDVLGSQRKLDDKKNLVPEHMQANLQKIKSGALLCFTTSKDFDNLILATVTYTSQECLKKGYIGIEIARQHNIGNIYDVPLIMFETPVFFEPYHVVFDYLKSCTVADFPMQKYIINEDISSETPAYMKENTIFECYGQKFHPIKDMPPNDHLKLNPLQLLAFSEALKREFALIHGAPGTGKTHLSVQIVKTLIENADTPIVLIAYTNGSLDKFLVKLSAYTENIARFGSQCRDPSICKYNITDVIQDSLNNSQLKRLYYITKLEFKDYFQKLQHQYCAFDGTDDSYAKILKAQEKLFEVTEKIRALKTIFQYYAAREKSIIAMTTTFAARTNFLFRLLRSKIVIFEEAAEILESHVVACLTPYTQHVIMIGDHQQLQLFTSNHKLQINCHMNISLFERLFKKQLSPIVLKSQYRMHPKIAELLCNTIYKELDCDESVFHYPAIRKMSTNLYFMTHKMHESRIKQDSSIYNSYEISQVIQLALHLVQNALYDTQDIHILSPYATQINMIKKKLANHAALRSLTASTVDSFQGSECNIIILSLVRSNKSQHIGFLKQSNRICVALSRAKYAMFIIGNLEMLTQCSGIWKQIKHKLLLCNAVGDKFPIEADNL